MTGMFISADFTGWTNEVISNVCVCGSLPFFQLRKIENISERISSKRLRGKSKHRDKDSQIFMSSEGRLGVFNHMSHIFNSKPLSKEVF